MTRAGTGGRFEALVRKLMPNAVVATEVADGRSLVRVGVGKPAVRLVVRDRAALRALLLRRPPLVAFALAYAEGALDYEGDILEVARLKNNFPQRELSIGERLRILWDLLRW